MLLQADWVLPISGSPLAGGAVVVKRGKILALGPAAELREEQWAERVLEFPGCVLMPGFVNAHTHLDYSAFQGFTQPSGFGRWMLALLRARRKLDPGDYAASALWGGFECVRSGITTIGDASFDGATVARAAHAVGLRARIYLEVFGLNDAAIPEVMRQLETRLERVRTECDQPLLQTIAAEDYDDPFFAGWGRASTVRDADEPVVAKAKEEGEAIEPPCLVEAGLSPHAPYTVSARLYREVARYARRAGLRLSTHVAESEAELELLTGKKNAITRVYRAANMWTGQDWTVPMMRPVQLLAEAGALAPDLLAVHAVQLDAADITTLASTGTPVAHCPRSNLRLRCGAAPVEDLLAAGAVVGLGTDSLASNDDFDMFAEMRAAMTVSRSRAAVLDPAGRAAGADLHTMGSSAGLDAEQVMRMATLQGARALGWDHLTGSLEVGKRADIIAVRLPDRGTPARADWAAAAGATPSAASALVEGATARDVVMTMIDGRVIFDGTDLPFTPREVLRDFVAIRKKLGST